MMIRIVLLFSLLIFTSFELFAQNDQQTVVSSDIDLFWAAYDKVQATPDSVAQLKMLQEMYVDKGTPGLKAFMEAKGYTAEAWLNCIRNYPKYWASIRKKPIKLNLLVNN